MSASGDWGAVQKLFDEVVDLDHDTQESRLKLKGVQPATAQKVRALLAAGATIGVLDQAVILSPPGNVEHGYSSLNPGDVVGSFTIDHLIGRGGMGEVYSAHRNTGTFNQRVALKLLRPEAAARVDLFDRETQILADLEHPGIARLIDGGIAADGRPYMAMEYVEGEPIDEWCRSTGADLRQRLSLIEAVCDAVGYAHAHLVIHCDLKPANILVDETKRIRLLDFGVARLLDDAMTTGAPTQMLVTPEFAAPEQLAAEASTVATDIYALGAVMYQVLAGQGPWAGAASSLPSIVRRVMNDDPEFPSKTAKAGNGTIPAARIIGDLDAIVMKAMRRTPFERYRSAAEMGDDIARHLRLEPVIARSGSARYMLGRFMRRYRWAVGASIAAVVALMIGAGGIAWQARQTVIERNIALAEARRSESIVRMLTVMFRDTASASGEDATVKQMLDQTATRLVGSLDTSEKSATLIATLSDLYVNLEDPAAGDALIRRALAKGIGKGSPVATAQLQMRLASSAAALGKTEEMAPLLDAAEPVFRADPDRYRGELVEINSARAQLLRRIGKLEDAIALLITTLPQANIVYVENHRDLLTVYNNLLVYMVEANQLDAMPAIIAQADAVIARTGERQSMQGLAIEQLKGVRLYKLDELTRAEAIFERVAAQRRAVFGRSAGLAVDMLQVGRAKLSLGKFDEAERVLGEARTMAAEKLGSAAPPTLIMGLGLAEALAEQGKTAEADRVLGEVTPIIGAMPKPGIPTGLLARAIAVTRFKQGRNVEARTEIDRAKQIFTDLGPAGLSYQKGLSTLRTRITATDRRPTNQAMVISR
ncbi:MAG: protein kinase [Sphingomicrobium sp.]